MWHADGTDFHAQSTNRDITDSCVYSIAGQALSVPSGYFLTRGSQRNHKYLAFHPPAEALNLIVYRMPGMSIAMPVELQDELDQCSVFMDLVSSVGGMYASLQCDASLRRFMCVETGNLVWSKVPVVPSCLTTNEGFSGDCIHVADSLCLALLALLQLG